jgi:hypothetical protein
VQPVCSGLGGDNNWVCAGPVLYAVCLKTVPDDESYSGKTLHIAIRPAKPALYHPMDHMPGESHPAATSTNTIEEVFFQE